MKGSGAHSRKATPLPQYQQMPKGKYGVNILPYAVIPFKALLSQTQLERKRYYDYSAVKSQTV